MWKIPLFDVILGENEIEAVEKVLRSGWLTMGSVTKEFEQHFAKFLGVRHALAVSSGTAALHLANLALGVEDGDEVICPSMTFVAGANSILYVGAQPVFADIEDTNRLNISPEDIERKISPRTKAIQVVHYAGHPCRMDVICDIAKRHRLRIIEDCAHAPGARYEGQLCGTIGDIGCFSFFSNKNMTTAEGGMVVTNDEEAAKRIGLMRSHGMTTLTMDRYRGKSHSYDVVSLGYNYRLDEIRAAMGIEQLKQLEAINHHRTTLWNIYNNRLSATNGIRLAFNKSNGDSVHHILAAVLENEADRGPFIDHLKNRGIQTSIHYPPVHLFDIYRRRFGCTEGLLPITETVGQREVTLPLYPSMSESAVEEVCNAVDDFFS